MKSYIKTHAWACSFLAIAYRIFCRNRVTIYGKGNKFNLNVPGLFLAHSHIVVKGNNNKLIFLPNKLGEVTHFSRLRIAILGNDNTIVIGAHSSGNGLSICIENDKNQILIGEHFTVGANTELAAIEGTVIEFGKDCQLSSNITLRTGDSHSVTDLHGKRTNPSKSIKIGNHVWIANTVLIFKGTIIGDNSIVAGGSVVCGKTFPPSCIIGGNPAVIIKEGVNWNRKRLPI